MAPTVMFAAGSSRARSWIGSRWFKRPTWDADVGIMTPSVAPVADLLVFARPVLINLAERRDRLDDSLDELAEALGRRPVVGEDLHLIRPRRFDDAAGFASPGFRSNFDAHLRAAHWAREARAPRLLVLEDDVAFNPAWRRFGPDLLARLTLRPWDLASLGYLDDFGEAPARPAPDGGDDASGPAGWTRFSARVNGAHAYLVNGPSLDDWIGHLEAVRDGTPGDDVLGPMASDGAINTFTWADPRRIRLVAVPNLVTTRPTRSDISPGLIDRLPVVSSAVEQARRWRRRRDRRRSPAG